MPNKNNNNKIQHIATRLEKKTRRRRNNKELKEGKKKTKKQPFVRKLLQPADLKF